MKRTAKSTIPAGFSELPKRYAALCAILMPRTIRDEIELGNVTEILDIMAGHKLTKDQADYMDTLATLAEDFEDQNVEPLPKLPPHEFLAAHLENIGLSASAWGSLVGIDRSTASRLLRGERGLTATHIRNTAKALHIAPELLI
jgi:antitoxin component HigA of HigAB toxin-antitoxin module